MLRGKQHRQAVPALRGYAYQIWRSLLAWLQLKDNEVLFLEGAEDFDVIEGTRATAVQVKNVKRKLTLRSTDAKEAMANYLELRAHNRGYRVSFRFLTTSSIGVERKSPFGPQKSCLDAWRQCQRTGDQEIARVISEFLLQEDDLPSVVRLFLEGSAIEDTLTGLIQPLTWETSQASTPVVEETVHEYLILHGERMSVPPSEAKKAAARLLQETLAAATRSTAAQRRLTRALFLEIFEEATTERVTRSELTILRRSGLLSRSKSPPEFLGLSGEAIHYASTAELTLRVPENLFPAVARPKLVAKAKQTLERHGLVLVTASAGMGKTTIAKEFITTCERPSLWVSLSRKAGAQIPRQLLSALDSAPLGAVWLLDDVDFSPQTPVDDGLPAFLYAARERGDWAMLTSQRSLPARLVRLLTLDRSLEVRVPRFDKDEVTTLAALLGCPDDRAREWQHVVLVQSRGHPQLIHAHLLGLRDQGWPSPSPEDLSRPPETVNREHQEMRALLLAQSPPDAVELMYGLSVYEGLFRREQAIAIGTIQELGVRRPGDALDSIIGPWVEGIDESYFRLSPLLENSGRQVWSENKIGRIRAAIAEAILATKNLSLIEASQLISLSLRGSLDKPLAKICTSLLQASGAERKKVAEHLSWLALVALHPGMPAVPGSGDTRFLFRWLQFRIAERVAPQTCPMIVRAWENEARASDSAIPSALRVFTLAAEVLIAFDAPVPVASVLRYLVDLYDQRLKSSDTAELWKDLVTSVWRGTDYTDGHYVSLLFLLVTHRCSNADDVTALIGVLDDLDVDMRGQLLGSFTGQPVGRALFIDRAWTAEVKSAAPRWERALDALRFAAAAGRRWGNVTIEATATAGMAAVFSEYLEDFAQAQSCLADVVGRLGPSPILEDQLAMVYFTQGNYESALAIWHTLLPFWKPMPNATELEAVGGIGSTLSCRTAAMCAARLEQWQQSSGWFLEGAARAVLHLHPSFVPGFEADAGFAFWKVCAYEQATECFGRSLRALDRLGHPDTDVRSRIVGKFVGHVLLWIKTVVSSELTDELGAPWAGMCSNPEDSPALGEMPQTPLDFSWLHLCQIEETLLQRSALFDEVGQRLVNSPYRTVRTFTHELAVRKAFSSLHLEDLPLLLAAYSRNVAALKAAKESGEDLRTLAPLQQQDLAPAGLVFGYDVFVAALLAAGARGTVDFRGLFREWRTSAELTEIRIEFEGWLQKAERVFDDDVVSARRLMTNPPVDRDLRLLSIARIALVDIVSPEERFYAHSLLFSLFVDGVWRSDVAPYLGTLVARQWLRAVESPATLRSPAITVPAIRGACAKQVDGMKKVAAVLLAVELAVNVSLPPSLRERLRLLSPDTS